MNQELIEFDKKLEILKSHMDSCDFNNTCKEYLREVLRSDNSTEKERLFNNAVSKYLSVIMNDFLSDEDIEILKHKTKKAIQDKDLEYELFARPSVWDKGELLCYKHLQEACNRNKHLLESRVKSIMNTMSQNEIAQELSDIVYNTFKKHE